MAEITSQQYLNMQNSHPLSDPLTFHGHLRKNSEIKTDLGKQIGMKVIIERKDNLGK